MINLVAVGLGSSGELSTRLVLASDLNAIVVAPETFSLPTTLAAEVLVMVLPSLNFAVSTTLSFLPRFVAGTR